MRYTNRHFTYFTYFVRLLARLRKQTAPPIFTKFGNKWHIMRYTEKPLDFRGNPDPLR